MNSQSLQAGRSGFAPIVPQTLSEVERLATTAVRAGWKGGASDHEQSVALAVMVILQGLEVGLPPTQALQTILVDAEGRFLIWGDAIPALLWAKGFHLDEHFDGDVVKMPDTLTAHCKITRPDGTIIARSYSVAEAKRARLWDQREFVPGPQGANVPNESFWYLFPTRMLQMRARGFTTKDGAADVTRGLYIREEYSREANVIVTEAAPSKARSIAAPAPPLPPGQEVRAAIADAEPVQDVSQEADAEEVSQAQPEPEPAPEPVEKPKRAPPRPPRPPEKKA